MMGGSLGAETLNTERAAWPVPGAAPPVETGGSARTACLDWLHAGAIVAAAGAAASAAAMNVSVAMRRAVVPPQVCAHNR